MTVYHFDTLPVHPQPEPLESLSSYLTRLTEANGLGRIQDLFRLCFPVRRAKLSFHTGDFPPLSFGSLSILAQCSEPALLATTFYHLGCKFDRSPNSQSLAQWLSGSLSSHLRYCPLCLRERRYYLLPWRFLSLTGCPEHGCYLLDRCGHCKQIVPLLTSPPHLGYCPSCGGDLRQCKTNPIDPARLAQVCNRGQDLVYLLQPQACETDEERMSRIIGQRFSQWRQLRRLKIRDIADVLALPQSTLYFLEKGSEYRGVKFQWYLAYAEILAISLRDIFLSPTFEVPVQSAEEKFLTKIRQAVAILEQQEQATTQQAVLQIIGANNSTIFTRYPSIEAFWAGIQEQAQYQKEQNLLKQVQHAIDHLRQEGLSVTPKAVASLIGCSTNILTYRRQPAVYDLILQHRDTPIPPSRPKQNRPKYRREPELMTSVQEAITELEREDVPISQKAVADRVGMSAEGLKFYPRIKLLLQLYNARLARQDETTLLKKVQTALAQLDADGSPITVKAISKLVGLSSGTLNYYPQVKAFLKKYILDEKEKHRLKQRQRREAELVKRTQQAIETLRAEDSKLNLRAIGELVGMSVIGLKSYRQVKQLLDQALHAD